MATKEMIAKTVAGFLYFEGKNEVSPQLSEKAIRFSNKKVDQAANLTFYYGQKELIGKRVYIDETGTNTIKMALMAVLPGEAITHIESITVTPDSTGYSFQGSGTGVYQTTFDYAGKMQAGKLTLHLTNVKLAENEMTKNGTWHFIPGGQIKRTKVFNEPQKNSEDYYYIAHKSYLLNVHTPNRESLLEVIPFYADIYLLRVLRILENMTFHPDGTLSATIYVPKGVSARDYKQMMNVMNSMLPECQLKEISFANLATYCIKDNELIITPNIEMMLAAIRKEVTPCEVHGDPCEREFIQQIYTYLLKWCTEGIRFSMGVPAQLPSKYMGKKQINEGEMLLQLTKEEIAPLFGASHIIRHRYAGIAEMRLYDWYVSKGKSLDEDNLLRKELEHFQFKDVFDAFDLMPKATFDLGIYLCKDKPTKI